MLNSLVALFSPTKADMTLEQATKLVDESTADISHLAKDFAKHVNTYSSSTKKIWDQLVKKDGSSVNLREQLDYAERRGLSSCLAAYQKLCELQNSSGLIVTWSEEDWGRENLLWKNTQQADLHPFATSLIDRGQLNRLDEAFKVAYGDGSSLLSFNTSTWTNARVYRDEVIKALEELKASSRSPELYGYWEGITAWAYLLFTPFQGLHPPLPLPTPSAQTALREKLRGCCGVIDMVSNSSNILIIFSLSSDPTMCMNIVVPTVCMNIVVSTMCVTLVVSPTVCMTLVVTPTVCMTLVALLSPQPYHSSVSDSSSLSQISWYLEPLSFHLEASTSLDKGCSAADFFAMAITASTYKTHKPHWANPQVVDGISKVRNPTS